MRMTSFARTPGVAVGEGDDLRVTAAYDGGRRRKDVMGIMLRAFVASEEPTGSAHSSSAPERRCLALADLLEEVVPRFLLVS